MNNAQHIRSLRSLFSSTVDSFRLRLVEKARKTHTLDATLAFVATIPFDALRRERRTCVRIDEIDGVDVLHVASCE